MFELFTRLSMRNVFYLRNTKKFVDTETSDNSWNNEREFQELYTPYVYGEFWSKWPSRFCFLSMRKAPWIPSLKIPRKMKTVSRVMQKSNATVTFHYNSNSVFKRNSRLYWSEEAMPSFIAYDGKRFAKNLDRYITTIVFKDGRRCKCIIWKSISVC